MPYPGSMQIRQNRNHRLSQRPQSRKKVTPPITERAVTSAVVGASIGTVGGEKLGGAVAVTGAGYLGYRIGSQFGTIGAVAGAAVGAGAVFFEERKIGIGRTAGAAAGFLAGGLTGGALGAGMGLISKVGDLF